MGYSALLAISRLLSSVCFGSFDLKYKADDLDLLTVKWRRELWLLCRPQHHQHV